MKLYELIKSCCVILGVDLPDYYFCSDSPVNDNDTVKRFVTSANFVLERLYCDYATAISKTVATSTEGLIDTSSIPLNRVISLKDGQGYEVKYRYTENGLQVDYDGMFNLTYAKKPTQVNWNSEIVYPSPQITDRIFIYGVMSEYCMSIGDRANANNWEKAFCDALSVAKIKTSEMTLPIGRWL